MSKPRAPVDKCGHEAVGAGEPGRRIQTLGFGGYAWYTVTMHLRILVSLAGILMGACAELPVLVANTCGNGALEGGEDCDLFVPAGLGEGLTCSAQCRFVCDAETTTSVCPAGWACGVDDICRFGAGTFEETSDSPLLLAAEHFLLGDVDADGAIDVVGGTADAVEIRFGNQGPGFRERFSLSTDLPVGRRALTRVGAGDALDVVSPTQEGVDVFFGDSARVLIPIGFAALAEATLVSAPSDDTHFVPMRAQDRTTDSFVAVYAVDKELKARVTVISDRPDVTVLSLGPAQGPIISGLEPRPLSDGGVYAMAVAAQGESEVHVVALGCETGCSNPLSEVQVKLLSSVSVAHLGTVGESALLADIDGDGTADLLVSVRTPSEDYILAMAKGRGAGQFAKASLRFASRQLCPEDECWPVALGDLDMDGRADFVFPTAIWSVASASAAPSLLSVQLEPFGSTTLVDLNGDGLLDVVGASEARGVIQILMNAGGLFNRLVLDVRRPAQIVQGGDFDGDGLLDVAFVQNTESVSGGESTGASDISVLFGNRSGPVTKPELMGRFLPVSRLSAGRLPSRTLFGHDTVSDLVVQVQDPENGRRLGFMTGSAQRVLHAPLPLPVLALSPSGVASVAVGADMRQTGGRDLVAFTFEDRSPGPEAGPFMYVLEEEQGSYPLDNVVRFGPDDSCLTASMLGHGCLQATSGRLFGASGVLVVNQRDDCPAPAPASALEVTFVSLQAPGQPRCQALMVPVGAGRAGPAQLVDMNGDGTYQAVLLTHGEDDGGEGQIAIWSDFAALPEVLAVPAPVLDIVAVNVDADPHLELAVLRASGISIAHTQDGAFQWPQELSVPLSLVGSSRLRAEDMNGDGLQDLMVGTPERLFIYRGMQSWLGGAAPEDQPAAANFGASSLRFSGAPSMRRGE